MQLILCPATQENATATLVHSVPIALFQRFRPPRDITTLSGIYQQRPIHCWATTNSNPSPYRTMRNGDIAMFCINGTQAFQFAARIVHKFQSPNLGANLWPVQPGLSWENIFFLDDIRIFSKDKRAILTELDYPPTFHLPKTIRVNNPAVRALMLKFGSFDRFIDEMPDPIVQASARTPTRHGW
jgi:hypothetical protein